MKNCVKVIIAVMVSLIPLQGFAAEGLQVEYLEGRLEQRQGLDTWTSVEIGDAVALDGTLRLSNRGYAELSDGSTTVSLTRDGLYEVSDLIGEEEQRFGLRDVIGSKFAFLNRRQDDSGITIAAVRGAEAGSESQLTWEGESLDYLADGIAYFDEGDFLTARDLFEEGSLWETGAVQRECEFRLGLTLAILGAPREARQALAAVSPERGDGFWGEYAVTMGTLYIESRDFDDAEEVLEAYLQSDPRGDAAQAAWLLAAYSKKGRGDDRGSRASLRRVVELGAETEIGRTAAEMLK